MSTSDNQSSPLLEEPVDFSDVKAWIAQQERNPQPLTRIQQRAIADLKRSLRSGEPDIGDQDWVSLLNSNIQQRPMPLPLSLPSCLSPSLSHLGRPTSD